MFSHLSVPKVLNFFFSIILGLYIYIQIDVLGCVCMGEGKREREREREREFFSFIGPRFPLPAYRNLAGLPVLT